MNVYAIGPLLVALSTLGFGFFTLLSNPRAKLNRLFFGICISVFVWASGYSQMYQTVDNDALALTWARIGYIGVPFIPVFVYHFIITFLDIKRPLLIISLTYACGVAFLIIGRTDLFLRGMYHDYFWGPYPKVGPLYIFFVLFFALVFLRIIFLLYQALRHHQDDRLPIRAEQLRYVLVGFAIATTSLVDYVPNYGVEVYPWGYLSAFGWLLAMGWACFRYRLLNINVVITRTAIFAIVYALILGIPFLAALAWQPQLEELLGKRWWAWLLIIYAVLATAAHYANQYFQRRAEDRLLAEEREVLDTLLRASRDMPRIRNIRRLVRVIVSVLGSRMRVSPVAVYLADAKGTHYTLASGRGYNPSPAEAALEIGAPLIQYLRKRKEKGPVVREVLLFQQRDGNGAADLKDVVGHMKQLGAECVVPSFSRDQLLGFLILGAKQSGRMYTDGDLKTLETLANQAALAIENARFYEAEKEHRAQMFHEAKLASLGKTANNMSHQINNRFHAQSILAGTRFLTLKDLDFRKFSWGELVQIIEQDRLTFDKVANDAIKGGDICISFLRHTRKTPPGWFSFVDAVKESATLCQYMNKDLFERVDYEKQIEESLPQLYGQKNDLVEVLNNMTTNAYDAIEKKEVMLQDGRFPPLADGQAYRGKIRIRVASTTKGGEPWIRAEFSDNGSGMTPEELEQLFTPFFTTKGAEKGTGVGTYIMQGMIQAHGGTLEVSSVYGEGTTFIILLPIKKPDVPQEGKKDGAPESPP